MDKRSIIDSDLSDPRIQDADAEVEDSGERDQTGVGAIESGDLEDGREPDGHEDPARVADGTLKMPVLPDEPPAQDRRPPWQRQTHTLAAPEPVVVARVGPERPWRGRWILAAIAVAALLLALFSLAVNYVLIQALLTAQDETRAMLNETIDSLDGASLGDFAFSYVFSDTIVYSGTMPISQTIVFPFQGTVPFKGNVPFQGVVPVVIQVPILGPQRFQVPVDTVVAVDTAVDVSTTVTIPVRMDFPFDVEMPVEVPIDLTIALDEQPALEGVVQQIREGLIEFRDRVLP